MVQHNRKTKEARYNTSVKQNKHVQHNRKTEQAWYNTIVKQNKHGTTQA